MSTTEISPATAASLGSVPGLFVQSVAHNGPSAAAGIQPADVITTLDGRTATQVALARLLVTGKAGQSLAVAYVRQGKPW
jgi:putative serine protease PepD